MPYLTISNVLFKHGSLGECLYPTGILVSFKNITKEQREFGDAVFESSFEKKSIFCLRLKLDYVIGFSGQMIKSEIGENVSHSIQLWFAFNC